MSDSSDRAKPASVAAFLFLPQFGRMFRSSSHLVPVLVRTIAHLFVQAGLLPPTHPSAYYGDPGVEKRGFYQLMGDAWYTLRSTAATPYQWSVFCSVLLMIFVLAMSIVSMAFNVSSGIVTTASAQIFTSPLGPTDIQNMPSANIGPCNDQTPLCRLIPAEGSAYGDYAIDLLDKMLRLGANQTGGPLQNATGALMQVYNSGILFVAACLLFWLVVSVVVDIARTGHVGGGRHNLVWAPIRIVFALGMMVPLGTSGFSSGQFAVMKIAEWGSNFGSNGWNAYLTKVMSSSNVVPELSLGDNMAPLAGSYTRLWICKVAHNGFGYQAEGDNFRQPVDPVTGFSSQEIAIRADVSTVDKGQMSYVYSNTTADALCGRVTFPTGNNPTLRGILDNPNADPVAKAEANFKISLEEAWRDLFVNGYSRDNPGAMTDKGLPLAQIARHFACGFVSQHIWGKVDGKDVLDIDCADGDRQCGSGDPGSGHYPDMSCIDNPNNEMDTGTLTGLISSEIYRVADAKQKELKMIPPDAIFGRRGWADMGSFYKAITTLTATVKYSLNIPIKIAPPGVQVGGDNQSDKVQEALGKYDDWLSTVPNSQPGPVPQSNRCNDDPPPQGCPKLSHNGFNPGSIPIKFMKAASSFLGGGLSVLIEIFGEAKKAMTQIYDFIKDIPGGLLKGVEKAAGDIQGTSFLGIPDANDPAHVNDYPLQILSSVGLKIMLIAGYISTEVSILEIGISAIPTIDAGTAIATSMLAQLINLIGETLMGCGFILVYYLPMMPYIRVSHAVLVWMVTVFEAVMLVPIACLSFLDTEKEGMYNKLPFINWLDILVRPILTVIGYVGAILVFDAFFGYLQASFANAAAAEVANTGMLNHFLAMFANAVLFCFLAYTAANTSFKMISLIPDSFFRWLPGGQASGASHWEAPNGAPAMQQMGSMASRGMSSSGRPQPGGKGGKEPIGPPPGVTPLPPPTGGTPTPSDPRLKENIQKLGVQNGFNIYQFNYIGNEQKYIGVMADEILKTHPEAVCNLNGYLAVYYDRIGVEFKTVN